MVGKRKKTESRYNKQSLSQQIMEVFAKSPAKTLNYKQIAATLQIKDMGIKRLIVSVLYDLVALDQLSEISTGKYKLKAKMGTVEGVVDMTSRGAAYIVSEEIEEDIFVSPANVNRALHGDLVKVFLFARKKSKQPEGEIVEIIKRKKTSFVGVIQMSKSFAFLVPIGRNMPHDIFIPLAQLNGAKGGDKAIAQITEWPKKAKNPIGRITDVLGKSGDNDTEMHAILAEFDLPYKFPEHVNEAAEEISDEITKEEIAKRRDFRNITTFTVDPADAKDFDDALSIQKLENGNWEVGVHIADVTHYVRPGSIIEKEACERATSVYLVDRVVPMLPERLSNGLCSLRPNEEKLTYSAVFEIDEKAEIHKTWIGRTVICSDRRFSYEEAQQVIETEEGDYKDEILCLDKLAKKFRAKRFKQGAIDFDRFEVKFDIDENGKPLSVYFKESKDSNKLIEEFMLLANKKVAESVGRVSKGKKAKTFVYRVHEQPNAEKLETFNKFIHKFGFEIKTASPSAISSSINNLLKDVKGNAIQNLVETLAIRSMAKAKYTTINVGHYGLHFDHYSHFTSPIRRYPDMMVHRLLNQYENHGKSANQDKIETQCQHCSDMELRASQAERSSIKYKQVEFMVDNVGEEFDGTISGVTEWGFYVELNDNKCEGMVSIRELEDDYYEFDEENYCIVGRSHKITYRLGDDVRVLVTKANLAAKQLDFVLA
ncbi:ribonuclease R [Ancylomarina sp. 16SWW S1-10-2]|uniref:ribonuclease R n=1 Tax=Ancylomarina sp. 16SWW S1-10-2 TaxID=2499681 RepID=UPI0012ADC7E4|nr:ribonuclease R [Ancylomarina sp. 16SWW S1-10-2]MRT92484.1 ribonuclease R [Ancylomarina sp. 16SWW S1-10-2]